jgi:hypothetical protein
MRPISPKLLKLAREYRILREEHSRIKKKKEKTLKSDSQVILEEHPMEDSQLQAKDSLNTGCSEAGKINS